MSAAVVTSEQPAENSLTDAKQSDSDRQSNQHESEYDTASDSPSDEDDDLQSGEYDDDIHSSEGDLNSDLEGDEDEEEEDADGVPANAEGEEGEEEEKKKVDDDEDRSNPQYIPKKGTFYEHDDRTADNPLAKSASEEPAEKPTSESAENVSSAASPLPVKAPPKKPSGGDKWSHDRFDMSEQAPKSSSELVTAYGYDIRSEDGPPKVKRSKHYGRGPTKYERNWEDENAYGKQAVAKRVPRGPPKGEDFPRLNERRPKKNSQSKDEPEGSEERSYNSREGANVNSRGSNNHHQHHRERRQGGGSSGGGGGGRGEGRGLRGNEKSWEFKSSRNQSGRAGGGGPGAGGRDPGRPHRRREDSSHSGGGGMDQDHTQQPQSFNGMSFTNSSLAHKRVDEPRSAQATVPSGSGGEAEDMSQRVIATANATRSVNYGSGRLQRRDDNKPPLQHFQHQVGGENSGGGGGLPLHAPIPQHQQSPQQQQQLPKRYSEKRQGMRSEQQSHPQSGIHNVATLPMMEPPAREHLHQQQQQQQLPQSHLQQSTGPPPPPFMSTRAFAQIELGPQAQQQMMAQQQQPPPPQQASVPQAQPLPQYANYFPPEFLPQSTTQPPVSSNVVQQAPVPTYQPQQQQQQQQATVPSANGQLMGYAPAMPQQNPAQYSQYPGYQNYAPLPIQAAPPSNVAYYAPAQPAAPQPSQAQPPPRAILPQRRPTNAIPIVSPPDRNVAAAGGKGRGRLVSEVPGGGDAGGEVVGKGGDDIDHILDNMFVRRPQQPEAQAMTTSTGGGGGGRTKSEEMEKVTSSSNKGDCGLDEGLKDLRLNSGDPAGGGGDGGAEILNET